MSQGGRSLMRGGTRRPPRWALARWIAVAVAVLALGAAGAGCGSDDGGGGSGDGGTTTAQRTRAVDPARQAKLMATGEKVFVKHCNSCHTMLGRKFTAPVIEFEAPSFDEVRLSKPAYIRERVATGGIAMQSFESELTKFQFEAIVAFVGASSGRNVDDDAADESPPEQLALGEEVFAERCHTCHGIAGEPRAGRPAYGGTDFNDVKPSQALVKDWMGRGLEGAMPKFTKRLSRAQFDAVAAYVASVAAEDPDEG